MSLTVGQELVLQIDKPAAGGRMLARSGGQVVLVWGAIPGESVRARIEKVGKGVAYATTIDVLDASPDRREQVHDWRCGGNVFAHVAYPRQVALKAEIIQDALRRIGRIPVDVPPVIDSPDEGYRMRARLHVDGARLGFFREGSHQLCAAGPTRQLLSSTVEWIVQAETVLHEATLTGLLSLEIAENVGGDVRACHLELAPRVDPRAFAVLGGKLSGLSAQAADAHQPTLLSGTPFVSDTLPVAASTSLTLRRDVRAFFQGNRFLLSRLVQTVLGLAGKGSIVDLYAGVGLFGLALAAAGAERVTLVEGDPISGADLRVNAEPFGSRVRAEPRSVESYLAASRGQTAGTTFIVDPPRTGMTRDALAGILLHEPRRLVYVSCDVATLARDARTLVDAGYGLESLTGIDLFPNTAHVESIALFVR